MTVKPPRLSDEVIEANLALNERIRARAEAATFGPATGPYVELDESGEVAWRLADARGGSIPFAATTVAEWSDYISQELRSERRSFEVAFRAFIGLNDDLAAAAPPLRIVLCAPPPMPCGDPRFDAAIAGLVEHHLFSVGLPVPTWVHDPSRTLSEVWQVSRYTDPSDVLEALLRHGVALAASELASV
jgi:hypothetical protein